MTFSLSSECSSCLCMPVSSCSLSLCYSLAHWDVNCLFFPIEHHAGPLCAWYQGGQSQQLGNNPSLYKLVKYLCARGQKINPTKIQGPVALVKFQSVQQPGICQNISFKIKDKLMHLITKKEAQWLWHSWEFGDNIYLLCLHSSGHLLRPTPQIKKKLPVWSEVQNKRRLCNRSRLSHTYCCHLGHMTQQNQWCFMCPWKMKMCVNTRVSCQDLGVELYYLFI